MLYKYNGCTAEDFHKHLLADDLNEWVASYHKQVDNPETGRKDWIMLCKIGPPHVGKHYETLLQKGGIKNPY